MAYIMLKAITFDLWNTLISNVNHNFKRINVLERILRNLGIFDGIAKESFNRMNNHAWKLWETSPFTFFPVDKRLEYIEENYNITFDLKQKKFLINYFEECILEDPPCLHKGVEETLNELKRNGFNIGLISDTGYSPGRIMRKVMNSLGILDYFYVTTFSDEIGYNKPHPSMFQQTLDKLGVHPSQTMHVGDLLRTDIAGANKHGIISTLVNRNNPMNKGIQEEPLYLFLAIEHVNVSF
jgi:HAD superfamily hydrolase (TIGR01509 family)